MPQKKLKDRNPPMVFIGYEVGFKAYHCFDPINGSVHVSRDVVFEEDGQWNWERKGERVLDLTFFPMILLIKKKDIKATLKRKKKTVKCSYLSPLLSPL